MSAPGDSLRDAVVRRAGNRCEYCQLPAQLQVGGFEVDHILPRSRGGQTDLANLALACPHCNARKWAHIEGEDPVSGQTVTLYNPRAQRCKGGVMLYTVGLLQFSSVGGLSCSATCLNDLSKRVRSR